MTEVESTTTTNKDFKETIYDIYKWYTSLNISNHDGFKLTFNYPTIPEYQITLGFKQKEDFEESPDLQSPL